MFNKLATFLVLCRYLRLVVAVRAASELDLTKQYRLDLSANKVAYERALAALEAFASRSGEPGGIVLCDMRLCRMSSENLKVHESPDESTLPHLGESAASESVMNL
jgi:hypothetical protein